jgi:hypothetical protein
VSKGTQGIPGRWNRRKRDIGLVIWVSFLSACAGTFALFAVLDPEALNEAWIWPWEIGRKLAYSLGFILFFSIGAIASALTAFMIHTGPRKGHYRGKGGKPPPHIEHTAADDPQLEIDPEQWR